jgi:hypothetical protein
MTQTPWMCATKIAMSATTTAPTWSGFHADGPVQNTIDGSAAKMTQKVKVLVLDKSRAG